MRKTLGIVAMACTLAWTAGVANAADTVLRISLQLPLASHIGENLLLFKEEVEKNSDGSIEVQIYDSAQLYKDKEVPQAVASGAIEMGAASLTRFVGDIPAVDIFYMPFMFNTEELVRKAVAPGSPVRAPLDEAILKTGARPLWWQAYGGAILISQEAPVKTPEAMRGKKVRVFGKTLGDFTKAVGGAPAVISGSEQFIAYQRGTVDIGMTGISGVKSRKLWEVMDFVTATNHADIEFVVIINEDFWQGLSDDERAVISAAALKAELDVRDRMSAIEAEAYKVVEDNGMTVYQPTAEEIKAWRASAQTVIDQFLAESGELGKKVHDAALSLQQ